MSYFVLFSSSRFTSSTANLDKISLINFLYQWFNNKNLQIYYKYLTSDIFAPNRPITAPDEPTLIVLGIESTDRIVDPTADIMNTVSHIVLPHSLSKKLPVSSCTEILP